MSSGSRLAGRHLLRVPGSVVAIPRPMRPCARPGFDGRPELRPVGGGDAEPDRGAGGAEGLARGEDHRDHGVLALLTELIFKGFGHIADHTSECTSYFYCSQASGGADPGPGGGASQATLPGPGVLMGPCLPSAAVGPAGPVLRGSRFRPVGFSSIPWRANPGRVIWTLVGKSRCCRALARGRSRFGSGLFDKCRHGGWLRHIDRMAGRDLDNGRPRSRRHRLLGWRGDPPVFGRNEVPARLGPPRRLADGATQGVEPQGTCESAMNAASSALTSAANESWNFSRSRKRKPSCGGRIGGTGAPGADRQ
jgi:hypothetical protein